jgi:hypothetical protein
MAKPVRYFRDSGGQVHRATDETVDEVDVPAGESDEPEEYHLMVHRPWESGKPPSPLTQAICGLVGLAAILWLLHGTIFSPF